MTEPDAPCDTGRLKVMMFGASGLVGGLLVPMLHGHQLTVVGRRSRGVGNERVVPVAEWPDLITELRPDVVISTLGTTIRQAGSREAFAAIDHDAVVAIAESANRAGARQYLMVSSVAAEIRSANFYLATKGRSEASVTALGIERIDIFRPGLLVGTRAHDGRPAERLAILLSPVTNFLTPRRLDRYRAIAAVDVAAAIARAVGASARGVHIHHNRDMLEPGRKLA